MGNLVVSQNDKIASSSDKSTSHLNDVKAASAAAAAAGASGMNDSKRLCQNSVASNKEDEVLRVGTIYVNDRGAIRTTDKQSVMGNSHGQTNT